ncbi:MAG: E3 binding domain-containing protein [Actinomycetota bacterium]
MERTSGTGLEPADLFRQWYEAGTKVWQSMLQGPREVYADPYGLYRQWFETMQDFQEATLGVSARDAQRSSGETDPGELWRRWFDGVIESWQKSAELGQETVGLTPRYIKMLEEARDNLMQVESIPKDPLEFAVHWYNATSGPYAEFVHDLIEREKFLEQASRWMANYASLYKVFRRRSEEYLSALQLPVRSDITRVASLIVALEDKVDRIEEAFEEFEYGYAEPATAEEVRGLEERLDRVEGKLDRLLAALENGSSQSVREVAEINGSPAEVRATEAARRKARELGIDLAEVRGTGSGGQITVEDVRRKGEES